VVKFKASEESALFQVGDEVEVLWNEVEQKPVQVRNLTIEKLRNPAPVLKRRPAPGR
jgi:hypothetical protein